ncbi:MAG TPA: tetratricopeptide repeat protein [bacterium]|nr:tetratricopeptide repeat protein [bacterium]
MRTRVVFLIVMGVFLNVAFCCWAQQTSEPAGASVSAATSDPKELSRFAQEASNRRPYGGFEQALAKIDQMLLEENYRDVVELSLLMMFRYWDDRLPLIQRCGRGLVGMERWKDAIESFELVARTAMSADDVKGATEFFYQDAVANLVVTQTNYWLKQDDSSSRAPESIKTNCLEILNEFPDEEFILLAHYKGWRHPEAILALGAVCVGSATPNLQSRELKLLEGLVVSTDGRKRTNLRNERGVTYSFLALRQWWVLMEQMDKPFAEKAQELEKFANRSVEDYTTPLAHVLLGRLYSSTAKESTKAVQYYKQALAMKLPPDDECWKGYHEECMDALEKLGAAEQ